MVPDVTAIVSLLSALLGSADAIERFARTFFGSRISTHIDRKATSVEAAEILVRELDQQGEIDDALFDRLIEDHPSQRQLIEQVRSAVLGEPQAAARGEGASPAVPDDLPPELAEWGSRLSSVVAPDAGQRAPEPPEYWLRAAAVLPHFDPVGLRPVFEPGEEREIGAREGALTQLATIAIERVDGYWELPLETRREVLGRMQGSDSIERALAANAGEGAELHAEILRSLGRGERYEARSRLLSLDHAQIRALADVGEWLPAAPIERDLLAALLERQTCVEPLQRLAGIHFRGRMKELAYLADFASAKGTPRILVLTGLGGVGKSALLGRFLLSHESSDEVPRPWAYLDFDSPEVERLDPRAWVQTIARQLNLLYATHESAQQYAGLEALSAGDTEFARLGSTPSKVPVPDLVEGLARITEHTLPPDRRSLLLVFDTFEQVQVRGTLAVREVRDFIDLVVDRMPSTRIVVSGRSPVRDWSDADFLLLENLDPESAEAVLESLEIEPRALRRKVIDTVGTNPLSIHMAASAIRARQLDGDDLDDFLVAGAQHGEIQGMLYTRILGHIQDRDVRRLAHPGLVVRRVTPDVIREVLAKPCGIDPSKADALFERLKDHVALFEPEDDSEDAGPGLRALVHRQDVRLVMLRLMTSDPARRGQIARIHELAISHYGGRGDPVGRAERIYHGLMSDEDPADLDALWDEGLQASLGRCWEEPLPERARLWLGPRIGRTHGNLDDWRTSDWELSAAREAKTALETNDPQAALSAVRVRSERTGASPLFALEARALRRLGRLEEARGVLRRGVESCIEASRMDLALRLLLLEAEVALEQPDYPGARAAADRAARLARETDAGDGLVMARELLLRTLRESGARVEAQAQARILEEEFSRLEVESLLEEPQVAGRVIRSLGEDSKSVLRKAALTFGNRARQSVIRPEALKIEFLLDRARSTSEGELKVTNLATEMGLSPESFRTSDLAHSVIRFNRVGDAIAAALEEAGDEASVRSDAFSMFDLEGMEPGDV